MKEDVKYWECLRACLEYIIDNEKTHWLESDRSEEHIYSKAKYCFDNTFMED